MARRIFRETALRRYNDGLNKIVLPRYASPPWLVMWWAFAGLLLALTALLWSAQMPVYATGPAVVIPAPDGFNRESEVVLAVFLPPEFAAHVRKEQLAIIHLDGLAAAGLEIEMTQEVAAVEPAVAAPATVRARYALDDSTGLLIDGPVVVALIRLDALAEVALGSVGEVKIEIGTQRGLALLPGMGYFFGVDNHAAK